jgi:FAD/FMN-containing dehydrogenase
VTRFDPSTIETLVERARGPVLEPGDDGYVEARTVWNARIDRNPGAVLRCTGTADVIAGVKTAREHDLSLSVKGGGHHVSGSAVRDDALVLDLGLMDGVRVDPAAKTARVGPGASWGDVDHETQAFGLAVPGGQDPNIGVAGLTLGGGVGWLSRTYGLTCDNLLAADVVTADGELVRASPDANPDLFWALRGGGGAFGVVTSLEFQLHEVGPDIFAGSVVYPLGEMAAAARRYRDFTADAPREVRTLFGSMVLPPADVYPASIHGTRVALILACYAGPPEEGRQALAPLRTAGDPLADTMRERTYTNFQQSGSSQGSMRTHLRSQYLQPFSDAAIDTIVDYTGAAPSSGATVFVSPRSGAETDPPTDATAYPHREDAHHCLVETRWTDPDEDERHVAWTDAFHQAVAPYTTGEAAMNFLPDDEPTARIRAAYGDNYERLRAVKREWDPDGVFGGSHTVDHGD